MYYIYVLQSLKDNRTYTGYTNDISKRLEEHNGGKVDATKHRKPFVIIFTESCVNLTMTKQREKYWKSGGGRRKIKRYFEGGFPPTQFTGVGEARPA